MYERTRSIVVRFDAAEEGGGVRTVLDDFTNYCTQINLFGKPFSRKHSLVACLPSEQNLVKAVSVELLNLQLSSPVSLLFAHLLIFLLFIVQ